MIHSFSMRNFCSFADEVEVSFTVGDQAPDNDLFTRTASGQRLSKALAVLGPNAGGNEVQVYEAPKRERHGKGGPVALRYPYR